MAEQEIVIDLPDADGSRVAQLHAVPHSPGWWLLSRVATTGLLLGVALSGMAAVIVGAVRRIQRQRDALNRLLIKAQQASQAKSEFLTNMSHELRTPLNAILGFAEVIRYRHFGDRALDRYSDYAADIHASGQHLLAIINDILDMAKIEAGRQELHKTECDLASIVEATVGLMRQQAEQAGLIIHTTLPEALRPILIDERLIRQILFNLLSNAIKFTASGGYITVLVSGEPEGATITVSDTGIGIRAEDLPLVLTPFGQVGSAFTRSKGGTGLGLPLCKAIVKLHGGQMHIDSELGRGTTVTVGLPFHTLSA
jgi:two-component system, cell cycle sensor histidine kinase PleC